MPQLRGNEPILGLNIVMNRKYPNILRILIVSPYKLQLIATKNIKKPYPYAMQGDDFGTETTEEDLQLGYKYGYKAMADCRKIMGKTPRSNLQEKVNKNQSTLTFHYL